MKLFTKKYDENVSECDQAIAFHLKEFNDARAKKRKFENLKELMDCSDLCSHQQENIDPNGNEVEKIIDANIVGKCLKLLQKSDTDMFVMSQNLLHFGDITSSAAIEFAMTGHSKKFFGIAKSERVIQLIHNRCFIHHSFRLSCGSSKVWPVKVDVRIATTDYQDENHHKFVKLNFSRAKFDSGTSFKTFNDIVFEDTSTQHEMKIRSKSGQVSYSIEIRIGSFETS